MAGTPLTADETNQVQSEFNIQPSSYISPAVKEKSVPITTDELNQLNDGSTYTTGAQGLKQSFMVTQDDNPEQAAKSVQMTNYVGVPFGLTIGSPDMQKQIIEAARNKKTNEINWNYLAQNYPFMTNYLSNPQNMAVNQDNMGYLAGMEDRIKSLGRSYQSGNLQAERNRLGYQMLMGDNSSETSQRINDLDQQLSNLEKSAPADFFHKTVYGALQMLPQWIINPMVQGQGTGAILGTAATAAGLMSGIGSEAAVPLGMQAYAIGSRIGGSKYLMEQMTGQNYLQFRNLKDASGQPLDENTARIAAVATGAVQTGLSLVRLDSLLESIPGGKQFLNDFVSQAGDDILQKANWRQALGKFSGDWVKNTLIQTGANVGITAASVGGELAAKQISGQNFTPTDPANIGKELLQTTIDSAAMFGLMNLPGEAGNFAEEIGNIKNADAMKNFYLSFGQDAAASKLRERLPEAQQQYIDGLTKDSPVENVYIPKEVFDTYFQDKKIDPAMVADEMGISSNYNVARNTGEDISIPLATWATKVVGTEHYNGLADDVKFDPEGYSVNEAKEAQQQITAQLQVEQERVQEYLKNNVQVQQGYTAVYNDIKQQLTDAGRPDNVPEKGYESWVDKNAQLWAAHAVAESTRRGISPEEWYTGANRPEVYKVNFMPGEVRPEIISQLNDGEKAFMETLVDKNQSIEQIQKGLTDKYNQIMNDQIDHLKESGGKGVQQGSLVKDEDGNVIDRVGRQSNNPQWYQDFYAKNGRAPRKGEYKNLAIEMLKNGYHDTEAQIPANQEFVQLDNTINAVHNLKEKVSRLMDKERISRPIKESDTQSFNQDFPRPEESEAIKMAKRTEETIKKLREKAGDIEGVRRLENNSFTKFHDSLYERQSLGDIIEIQAPNGNIIRIRGVENVPTEEATSATEQTGGIDSSGGNEQVGVSSSAPSGGEDSTRIENQTNTETEIKNLGKNQGSSFSQDARANVQINPEHSIITLFHNADASSFIHESSHVWLADMHEYIKSGQGDENYQKNWQSMARWLDIADGQDKLTTEQQEKFAKSFEAYLREGKAPNDGLRKAFVAFQAWLTRIYKNVKGLNVDMSDEVRRVMDRMLVTDDEVNQADMLSGESRDPEIDTSKLPENVASQIEDLRQKSLDRAKSILNAKQMDELKPEHQDFLAGEEKRISKVIEGQLKDDPTYKAIEAVRTEIQGRIKKDFQETATMYREKTLNPFQMNEFDRIAEEFGYGCGDEMAQKFQKTLPMKEEVASRTATHMAQFNDLMNTPEMTEEAIKALHNDSRLELLAMEHNAYEDLAAQKELKRQSVERARADARFSREVAKKIMDNKPWRQTTSAPFYFRNEKNAAVKAAEALGRGDFENAAKYKRQQMLNHALAMEAIKIKDQVGVMFRFLDKYSFHGRDLLGMPVDFANQVDALLERFSLSSKNQNQDPNFTREPIGDFVRRMQEDYHIIAIADNLLSEGYRKDYKDLSLGELRDLYQGVKSLSMMGRKYNQYLSEFNKTNISMSASEAKESIESYVGKPYEPKKGIGSSPGDSGIKGFIGKLQKIPDSVNSWLVKGETICRFLDGDKDNGPMQKYLVNPFSQAYNDEVKLQAQTVQEFQELLGKYYSPKEMAAMKDEKIYFPEIGRNLTKEEMISLGLNWGNDGNRDRIRRGFNIADEQVGNILKNLTKKDWDMIQDTWDYLDKFWPDIKKLDTDVAGVEPAKVEPTQVETPYGTYAGGYYPIAYDPEKSSRAFQTEAERNALYKQYSSAHAMTDNGHTKERVSTMSRPVKLDFEVLTNHLINVIHDLTHRRAVIDANRFLNQPDVRTAVENALGSQSHKVLQDWVKSIASDQTESMNVGDRAIRWMRKRVTISSMGLNVLALPDFIPTNALMSAWELGAMPTARAIVDFTMNPKDTHDMVTEKSVFMKNRMINRDRDVYDFSKQTFEGKHDITRFLLSLHGLADEAISLPAWKEAYTQAIAKGLPEQTAIENADGVVRRAFGSGAKKDLSGVQRGNELTKTTSMFYSWANTLFNRYWMSTKTAGVEWSKGNKAQSMQIMTRALFYGWILPGLVTGIVRGGLQSHKDEDDEAKTKRFMAHFAEVPFSSVPLVRDTASYGINAALGQYADYKITPVEDFPVATWKALSKAPGFFNDEKSQEAVMKGASYWAPYPQKVNTWAFNFLDWMKNDGQAAWQDIFSRKQQP